jgi:Transposase DDE domain
VAFIRTVKTASGATAVQIVHSHRRRSRDIEHIGSAHAPEDVEALRAVARQRLHTGQDTDPRRRTVFYQYRTDRARRTLKGIDQQVGRAEKAVAGQAAIKRNRFVQLTGGTRSVNRDLEAKTRALAGLKGYVTNLEAPTAEYVMGAYHQLWQIEKSFRMSKSDLRARPIYHHKRDSIEAHLSIVFAALAVSRLVERATGWSTARFVTTLRRYHTIQIQAGIQTGLPEMMGTGEPGNAA